LYVKETYIDGQENPLYSIIIVSFVIYPFGYEIVQLVKGGPAEYFGDVGNYLDIAFLWGSIGMAFVHAEYGPYNFWSKLLMYIVLLSAIRRTFNFLRIFSFLSHIVTMLA